MPLPFLPRSIFGSPALSDISTEVAVVDRSGSHNLLFCKKPIDNMLHSSWIGHETDQVLVYQVSVHDKARRKQQAAAASNFGAPSGRQGPSRYGHHYEAAST